MSALRLVFLLLAFTLPAFAGTESASLQKRLGLTVSLTANRYRVTQPAPATKPVSFVASVVLTNHSREAVPFTFPDAGSARNKFVFRVIDAGGDQVWESEAPPSAQVLEPVELKAGKAWRRTLQIPLTIGGEALAPGRYTLQASLADVDGGIGASTRFEVISPWGELDPLTGIEGTVVRLPNMPAANETVAIKELRAPNRTDPRPPFTATTRTDEHGNFRIVALPGRYRVTAGTVPLQTNDTVSSIGSVGATAEVTVVAGSFAHLDLTLLETPILPPDFVAPPMGFGLKLWQDYFSDDVVVEVTVTVPTGGYSTKLVPVSTADGVARFAFGIRAPTGMVTQAFQTLRVLHKLARTPGLRRVEVNQRGADLSGLLPVPPLSADTGVDVYTLQSSGSELVPFTDQRVRVISDRSISQSFVVGPDGQFQPVPIPPPFVWEGRSDDHGRVSLDLPPGGYDVTLAWSGEGVSVGQTHVFTVRAGQRQRVTIVKRAVSGSGGSTPR